MLDNISQESGEIKPFKYLDDLIHSGMDEITLEYDIVLGEDEEELYKDGIKFENVSKINGNGHIIDARYKAQIFSIKQDCYIKNLKFKRGLGNFPDGIISLNSTFYYTFENCLFESNKSQLGIICSYSSRKVHLKKCKFNKNESVRSILYSRANRYFIDDCIFTNNLIQLSGLISVDDENSRMIINNTVFSNNSGKFGAVIHIGINKKLSINNCTFEENVASMAGGAIYIDKGNVTINESSFINNIAESEEIRDDDCCTSYKDYYIEESDEIMTIFDEGGGAICNKDGSVTILDSTFTGNRSGNKGGGIYNKYGTVTILKSTFTDNEARYDEIIYNDYGTITLLGNDINVNSEEFYIAIYNERGVLISVNDLDGIQFDKEKKNFIYSKICKSNMVNLYYDKEICEYYNYKKIEFNK